MAQHQSSLAIPVSLSFHVHSNRGEKSRILLLLFGGLGLPEVPLAHRHSCYYTNCTVVATSPPQMHGEAQGEQPVRVQNEPQRPDPVGQLAKLLPCSAVPRAAGESPCKAVRELTESHKTNQTSSKPACFHPVDEPRRSG